MKTRIEIPLTKELLQVVVDDLPISELTNTDASPFWFVRDGDNKFARRYKHETGKRGDVFYDGNNGDRWLVRAINTKWNRAAVENTTQHGVRLVFWGDYHQT